jgi:hypothetical protein
MKNNFSRNYMRNRVSITSSLKVFLLVITISLILCQPLDPALAQGNPQITRVDAPSQVMASQSFQVAVKLSNIYKGGETRVKIFDPSTQQTWGPTQSYQGTSDGTVGATLTITAPTQGGDWCIKALLEFRTTIDSTPFSLADQRGFCVSVIIGETTPSPTPTPTPTPEPTIPVFEVETDWAVGRVWMDPEQFGPASTIPYINEGEGATYHAMIYLRSFHVIPAEYMESVRPSITAQVFFLMDGTMRNDLFSPQTLDVRVGTAGQEVSTRSIAGIDGGRTHTFGFRVTSYFLDPESANNENTTQFIIAGLPSAKIISVNAPNFTAVNTPLNISINLEWAAAFGADLKVILIDLDGASFSTNMTFEKPISGAVIGDVVSFAVTAPSSPMEWNLRAEAWTRANNSTEWRHDSSGWSRDFTITVTESVYSARVTGVGGPGSVFPGGGFSISPIISYNFSDPTTIHLTVGNMTAITETIDGVRTKSYTMNMTAPSVEGPLEIRVQVQYEKEGILQHDDEQWYKTLIVNVSSMRAMERVSGPLPDWWYEQIENPFKDRIIDPITDFLFGS